MGKWGLMVLDFKRDDFTWSNKHDDRTLVWKHLDRGIANALWRVSFDNAYINNEGMTGSNHKPITVTLWKPK